MMMEHVDKFPFVGLRCRGGYNGSIGFPPLGEAVTAGD